MNARILIADDSTDTPQILTAWLQGEGFDTRVASGRDLTDAAVQFHPDLILLGEHTAPGGAVAICEQLRISPLTDEVPVILLTTGTPAEARMLVLHTGAVDYAILPLDLVALRGGIKRALATQAQYFTDAARVLDEFVYGALATLDCDLAWLFHANSEAQNLEGLTAAHRSDELHALVADAFHIPMVRDNNLLADALANRQPVLDLSVEQLGIHSSALQLFVTLETLGISHVSLMPLTTGPHPRGLLLVGAKAPLNLDSERGWQLTTSLMSQAMIVLDYVHLAGTLVEQEEMMEAEHAFLTMILDAMGDGLVVVGAAGEIEYINSRLLTMAGYAGEELTGQRVDMLFHPDDRADLINSILRGPGSTMKFDQRLYTRAGSVIPVLLSRSSFGRIDPDAAQQIIVLSDLTAQKNREEELKRQGQQLKALNQAAKAISSTLSPHEVLKQILDAAVNLVDAQGASVLLRSDHNPNELVFVATVGPQSDIIQGLVVPVGEGVAGWVAREATSQLVADTEQDERFYQHIDHQSGLTTQSLLAVPLIISDRVIGVLEAINRQHGTFSRMDVELLESIAGSAAVAIENARLFEQTRQRLNDLGTLLDASAAVSSTLDFGSVLELIARRLLHALDVERCVITTWDRNANLLASLAEVVNAHWTSGTGPVRDLADSPLRKAVLGTGTIVQTDLSSPQCTPKDREEMLMLGQQAIMGVPVRVGRRLVGIAVLYSGLDDFVFGADTMMHAEQIIRDWSQQFVKGDPAWTDQMLLNDLAAELLLVEGVMWLIIEEWQPQDNLTRRVYESGFALWTERGGMQQSLNDFSTMLRVLTIAQPKVVSLGELENDPNERHFLESVGGHVCLMAPLLIRGKPEGLVKLIDSDQDRHFDAEQISLCQGIANVVGNAMENAHLYQSLERRAEALEAAYDDLKQADQLKDDLLQNLSHEIQTPLLHILGYMELMQSGAFGPLTDDQQEKMSFVIDRAQHLSDLTRNIITMQSLQTREFDMQMVNLAQVLKRAIQIWEPVAGKRAINISMHLPDRLPLIMADEQQLTEAVEHLLDNAIKFSGNHQKIEITALERDVVVQINVRDYGVGIAPEYHEHIFQRFFQVDGGTARKFGGTGLGLAIVQEIVTRHNGQVWVDSIPGQGSKFSLTIPKTGRVVPTT
jgi:PAS domain S-box-containing protein